MDAAYQLVTAAPPVDDYLNLRCEAGLSPRTRAQAEAALPGGWADGPVTWLEPVLQDLYDQAQQQR